MLHTISLVFQSNKKPVLVPTGALGTMTASGPDLIPMRFQVSLTLRIYCSVSVWRGGLVVSPCHFRRWNLRPFLLILLFLDVFFFFKIWLVYIKSWKKAVFPSEERCLSSSGSPLRLMMLGFEKCLCSVFWMLSLLSQSQTSRHQAFQYHVSCDLFFCHLK